MKQARFTEAQIVDILSQAARDDVSARDVCRIHGISEQTYYRWKRRFGDMTVSEVKRLLAERDLEIDVIKDVLRGK